MTERPPDIAGNLARIRESLEKAAKTYGHPPPKLVAVSKSQGQEKIRAALAAGHRIFGENRVQEAAEKWPALRKDYPDVELHMIGPLQSNKVADAVTLFDVIETLDRPKIARRIKKEMEESGREPRLLVQVNTGEEPQKAGVKPGKLPALLAECERLGLQIEGLMCLPPVDEEPAPHFALLKKLGKRHGLSVLSMGMSADYGTAAGLGAGFVRIGTGVFGPRQ